MKKIIFLSLYAKKITICFFVIAVVMSCASESSVEDSSSQRKIAEINKFQSSLKSVNKQEIDSRLENESEESLKSRKLDLLIDSSKSLLLAYGYNELEVDNLIKNNKELVVRMALDIYVKNNK